MLFADFPIANRCKIWYIKGKWFGFGLLYCEAVAQGKNPSAAASLRLNASRSAKTLAIDPLISKKQITQTDPSEKRLFSRGACFPNFQKSEIQVCFRLNQMQILQSTVALCQQVSNVLGKPQKQKLRQNFDFTAGKETLEIPIVL